MIPNQVEDEFPEVQAAIYRVALSLDALLVNGIQNGVLRGEMFSGFLQTTASNLLRDLSSLEEQARMVPMTAETNVTAILEELRTRCQELIELVTGLKSFRRLPMEQLRSILSQIPLIREGCVQLLGELEACFRTPKPFYPSRPGHSTATV